MMTWIRSVLFKLSIALSLELLLLAGFSTGRWTPSAVLAKGIPERWEAQQFQPPSTIGIPSRREAGASRGDCVADSKSLTALMPISSFGVTVDAYPTWFFYLPATQSGASPPLAEFVLMDENEQDVYKVSFNTTGTPGIVSISLPAFVGLPPLKVGKDYQWSFALNCSPQDNQDLSRVLFVSGHIRRVPMNTALDRQLKQASSLRERAELYAEAEIWHDALAALAELRQSNPNDPTAIAAWENLLKSVELDAIANEPFVQSE